MFLGMTFCLPLAYYVEHQEKKKEKAAVAAGEAAEPLLGGSPVRARAAGGRAGACGCMSCGSSPSFPLLHPRLSAVWGAAVAPNGPCM